MKILAIYPDLGFENKTNPQLLILNTSGVYLQNKFFLQKEKRQEKMYIELFDY